MSINLVCDICGKHVLPLNEEITICRVYTTDVHNAMISLETVPYDIDYHICNDCAEGFYEAFDSYK